MRATVVVDEVVGLKVTTVDVPVVPVPLPTVIRAVPQVSPTAAKIVPAPTMRVKAYPTPQLAPVALSFPRQITIIESGGSGSGDATYVADGPISGHTWVSSLDPGHCQPSDNRDSFVGKCVGITLNAADDGEEVLVRSFGALHEPSWNWTPDVDIMIGEAGQGTQTPPSPNPGHVVYLQVVGWATGAHDIFIDLGPDPTIISSF